MTPFLAAGLPLAAVAAFWLLACALLLSLQALSLRHELTALAGAAPHPECTDVLSTGVIAHNEDGDPRVFNLSYFVNATLGDLSFMAFTYAGALPVVSSSSSQLFVFSYVSPLLFSHSLLFSLALRKLFFAQRLPIHRSTPVQYW